MSSVSINFSALLMMEFPPASFFHTKDMYKMEFFSLRLWNLESRIVPRIYPYPS